MKLFFPKIKKLRKEKGFSIGGLCKIAGISRSTLWKWEKGIQSPFENNIRNLALALGVQASEISDLKDTEKGESHLLDDTVESWERIAKMSNSEQESKFKKLLYGLNSLNKDVERAKVIINALKSSMAMFFYIKDVDQKYIIASDSYIAKLGLIKNFNVFGKKDNDFLAVKDAKENSRQDEKVLSSGNDINSLEGYIPGTRKKEWGLISKKAIRNNENKIIGLICIIVNITDRKKAELKREMLEKLLDAAPTSIIAREFYNEKFWYVNKTIELQTGYPRESFYDNGRERLMALNYGNDLKIYEDYKFPENVEFSEEEKNLMKLYNNALPILMKFPCKNKDGQSFWKEEMQGFMKLSNKFHKIFYHRNCTEEKQTQLEGIAQKKLLEELSGKNKIIWMAEINKDSQPIVTYLNDNFEKITGYKKSEFYNEHDIYYPDFQITYPLSPRKISEKKKNILSILLPETQKIVEEFIKKEDEYPEFITFKLKTNNNKIITMKSSISKESATGLKTIISGICRIAYSYTENG